MLTLSITLLNLLLLALSASAVFEAELGSGSAFLDSDEKFHISWTFTSTNITITAIANTTGWLGIGFSPNGGMEGADIITAWVKDGKTFLQDRFVTTKALPVADKLQDVHLISGSEMNGQTKVVFTRKLTTCDPEGTDLAITADTVRMIWAMSSDNTDPVGDDPVYHNTNRGTRSLYLLIKEPVYPDIPNDAITFDFLNKDFAIPAQHTMYWCEIFRAPSLTAKYHMIKSEPVIPKENLGFVHHILLYGCYDNIERNHYFEKNNTGYGCLEDSMPDDRWSCRTVIVAWAIGGGPMYFPHEAGFPFGENDSPKYFVMETHYDNPQLVSGTRDISGIRITLTPTLRKYDAGILTTAINRGIAVPPKLPEFQVSGFCTSNCTQAFIPSDGIKVFNSFLHAHLMGRKIVVRHFRNGKELDVFSEDRHYDFNYQQGRPFDPPKTLLRGDELMIQCSYNSMDRINTTFYGLPSTSEMCMAFLAYYPKQEVHLCATSPSWISSNVSGSWYLRNRFQYNIAEGESTKNALARINWTPEHVRAHQLSYTTLPHQQRCVGYASRRVVPAEALYDPPPVSVTSSERDPVASCQTLTNGQGTCVSTFWFIMVAVHFVTFH